MAELRRIFAYSGTRALIPWSYSRKLCCRPPEVVDRRRYAHIAVTVCGCLPRETDSCDYRNRRLRHLTSAVRPPEPPADLIESAAVAGERGLRILRESSEALSQDEAMEAWHCLLKATCATEQEPRPSRDLYFALGNLHYLWGDLLEKGKKAELGAEGAARAVVAEVQQLRRQALRKRTAGSRATKKRPDNEVRSDERRSEQVPDCSLTDDGGNDQGLVRPLVDHLEAWGWYLKAAEHGDSRAMMQLGEIAMEGATKSTANAQLADDWYRRSAEGDPPQPDALFQLARMHHEGIGVPLNLALARELYEEACEAGSSAAAYFLGHRLHVGDDELGVDTDYARALELLNRASDQGHPEAMYYLAQAHRSGSPELGLSQDLRKFGELIQQSAAAGSADGMFAVGGAFFHGDDGFPRDPRAAFRYYSAAAGLGHADASYCLGVMHYAMGDLESAFRCYQTAAEGGNMLAWRNIASMYALGEGVVQSEKMAKHILATLGDKINMQEQEKEEDGEGREEEKKPSDV